MNVVKAKKSYKSKVYSVRWDNEKMAFLQSREKKLETGQEIADFLMNNYWWQHKMPHVTAKEAPPLELKNKNDYRPMTPESYDGKKITTNDDEPLQFSKPKMAIKRTPAHWVELRRECENADDYAKWLENLENDTFLTAREKKEIKATV